MIDDFCEIVELGIGLTIIVLAFGAIVWWLA
jgi:hypothetical protein